MPECYCRWARCNGKVVAQRVFDKHQREDKRSQANAALDAARQACEDQDAVITSYISALTLSDATTGVSATPGGRLWSCTNCSQLSMDAPTHSSSLPVTEALNEIRDIEKELDNLIAAAGPKLHLLGKPLTCNDAFPLQSFLCDVSHLQDRISSVCLRKAPAQEAKKVVTDLLLSFLGRLRKANSVWNKELNSLSEAKHSMRDFNTEHHFDAILPGVNPIVQASIFTVVALQVVVHVSRRGCHFLFSMLRYIIQLALMRRHTMLSVSDTKLLSDFPVDPETATQKFRLSGQEIIWAICPNAKCHRTYLPTFSGKSPIPIYPQYCTHKQFTSGPECATRLTHPRAFGNIDVEVPLKCFVSFSFKNYVASLTSRPGFEDMMDAPSYSKDNIMQDVIDGHFLSQDFKGPDGAPFQSTLQNSRYIFSLCIDFFNPFTNKQAGKKASIGIISIVCLSLPPSLRYRPENMFLAGIIPGPNEPPLTAINHYLTPVVDELEQFWDPGVCFSRTFNHPEGRLIFCALILVVCDLLAARKTAGFAACNHEHFCSICHCRRSQEGYSNTDYSSWKRRTDKECRDAAEKYLTAKAMEERIDEFNRSGVRWSELLRLTYFDISRCVVVDSMHNLFLGLIKEHFNGILGIAVPSQREKVLSLTFESPPPSLSENDLKGIEKLKAWLEGPADAIFPTIAQGHKKLMGVNLNSLSFVCQQLGCSPTSKDRYYKMDYAVKLLAWRLQQPEDRETGADSGTQHGHILNKDEMTEIWQDIESILTPSWLTSVPSNLGSASHGKLKADQWRALGTVHLPLSLTRLWSLFMTQMTDDPRASRCHGILQITMALVSAVILATSRSITIDNAAAYHDYMLCYLEGIKHFFPEYKMRPNHHMSLHIYEYLLLFGPVHSWWTFPFERMIGAIQRMPNNNKIGELEETIACAYTRSANLRAIVTRSGCPEVIQHLEFIFRKFVDPQMHDILQADIQAFSSLLENDDQIPENEAIPAPRSFPEELQAAFATAQIHIPGSGHLLSNLTIGGLVYSIFSKHHGNSCVMFTPSQDAEPIPARIFFIVQFTVKEVLETYIAVRCHKFSNLIGDPFSSFLALRTALWDEKLDDLEIIRPIQITSHFACLPITLHDQHLVAALSLSRNYLTSARQHAFLSLQDIQQLKVTTAA